MANSWILVINHAILTKRALHAACSMALRVRTSKTIFVWIQVCVRPLPAGTPGSCTSTVAPIRLARRMVVLRSARSVSQPGTSAVPHLTLILVGNQYSWSVLQCEPGKFCCRAAYDTENCCNNNQSVISTSHIGSLLLPGSTSVVNTTYNAAAGTHTTTNGSSSDNSTCASSSASTSSSNSTLIDRSQCPADHSATVGGAVGGILGAALIGAIVALVFALQSRKHAKNDLGTTQTALTATETRAAEEKANHQKQMEDQQRHMQTMPPNYPQNGGYPIRPRLPNEMDSSEGRMYSELSGADGSLVELTSETAKSH